MHAPSWRISRTRLLASVSIGLAIGWGSFLGLPWRPRAVLPSAPVWNGTSRVYFSNDSQYLVVVHPQRRQDRLVADGHNACSARLWNVADGSLVAVLADNDDYISWIAFSIDNQRIAGRMTSGKILVWNCPTGRLLEEIPVQKCDSLFDTKQVGYTADGRLLSQDVKAPTRFINAHTGDIAFDWATLHNDAANALLSRHDFTVVQSGKDVQILRPDGLVSAKFLAQPFRVRGVSDDCRTMFGMQHGKWSVWQTERGLIAAVPSGEYLSSLNFLSPDGKHFVVFDKNHELRWKFFGEKSQGFTAFARIFASDGTELPSIDKVSSGAFSPNGQTLALASDYHGGAVQLWNFPPRSPWHLIVGAGLAGAVCVFLLPTKSSCHFAPAITSSCCKLRVCSFCKRLLWLLICFEPSAACPELTRLDGRSEPTASSVASSVDSKLVRCDSTCSGNPRGNRRLPIERSPRVWCRRVRRVPYASAGPWFERRKPFGRRRPTSSRRQSSREGLGRRRPSRQ